MIRDAKKLKPLSGSSLGHVGDGALRTVATCYRMSMKIGKIHKKPPFCVTDNMEKNPAQQVPAQIRFFDPSYFQYGRAEMSCQ